MRQPVVYGGTILKVTEFDKKEILVQSEYLAEEVASIGHCSWACGLYTKAVKPCIGAYVERPADRPQCRSGRRRTAEIVVVSKSDLL